MQHKGESVPAPVLQALSNPPPLTSLHYYRAIYDSTDWLFKELSAFLPTFLSHNPAANGNIRTKPEGKFSKDHPWTKCTISSLLQSQPLSQCQQIQSNGWHKSKPLWQEENYREAQLTHTRTAVFEACQEIAGNCPIHHRRSCEILNKQLIGSDCSQTLPMWGMWALDSWIAKP